MIKNVQQTDEALRDGIETLPEPLDLQGDLPFALRAQSDEDPDEALLESFPASDPPASGRMDRVIPIKGHDHG